MKKKREKENIELLVEMTDEILEVMVMTTHDFFKNVEKGLEDFARKLKKQ